MSEGKPVFTGVCCIYIKANVWKKSISLSRLSVFDMGALVPPFRLVAQNAETGEIQLNSPVTLQMAAKRSRDDFITFLIQYPNGQNICYGVQMAARKYADQFLIALNNVTKQTNNAKLKGSNKITISAPASFRQVSHGSAGGPSSEVRLPPGWMEARSPEGRPYYYNESGETTWNMPTAPASTPDARRNAPTPNQRSQASNADPAAVAFAQKLLDALPPNLKRVNANEVKVAAAIGKGCYGTVYEGKWANRAVAVKMLDVSQKNGQFDKSLKEFDIETRIMAKISEHPNVLGILGVLVDLPNLAIVMEFMELTDLFAVLTSGDPISASMEDMWIKGIAAGLRHVARNGVIHRDVAARNVLLNRDYRPKIADFGLAVTVAENGKMDEAALNKWLSPEAIRDRVYTLKSDVWSYGVTCWEIVTKQIPYPGLDPMMAAMRIVGEGLTPDIPPNCAPQHAAVMRACFVIEQEQRASMEDVCRILNVGG